MKLFRLLGLFLLMVAGSIPGFIMAQNCQTIASGDILNINNWLCDCNIEECDTIIVSHQMTLDDTLLLENILYSEVTMSGSIGGTGSIKIAGNLINKGFITIYRLATDVDPFPEFDTYFKNEGVIENNVTLLLADSTINLGSIINSDSLIVGVNRKLYNQSLLHSRILYGLGPLANYATMISDSMIIGRAFANYGEITCNSTLEAYSLLFNEGSINAANYEQWSGSVENYSDITVTDNTTLGLFGGIQFEQTPGARITTRNLYVLENTDIRGLGSVCILEHAENHGNLIGSMQLCDLTPTMTTPPFWDVHTGTIVLNPTYCGPLACATVDVAEPAGSTAPKLFPNPTAGTVHVEWGPGREVVHEWTLLDALGQRMMHSNAAVQEHLVLDLSTYAQGTYWLVLQDAHGAVLQRVPVVVAR
jgi:hypothetical protein